MTVFLISCLLCRKNDCLSWDDYHGNTSSSICEEMAFNPRLQVKSAEEYAELMANLNLPMPEYIDIAVPANLKGGISAT